ncbi:MAG: hypothetical protein MHM6MM_005640 [Cercozoa sp. M6MM]
MLVTFLNQSVSVDLPGDEVDVSTALQAACARLGVPSSLVWAQSQGRPVRAGAVLSTDEHLRLNLRLLGGGGDGGSIPKRSDLAFTQKKRISADAKSAGLSREDTFRTCFLTAQPLDGAIVCDYLGRLMRKEALLEYLLTPTKILPPSLKHIKGTSDFFDVKLERIESDAAASEEERKAAFRCPLLLLPANGQRPFVAYPHCGCVLSQAAHRQQEQAAVTQGESARACAVCQLAFPSDVHTEWRVIPLFPQGEQLDEQFRRLEQRRLALKAAKKRRRALKKLAKQDSDPNQEQDEQQDDTDERAAKRRRKQQRRLEKQQERARVQAAVAAAKAPAVTDADRVRRLVQQSRQKHQAIKDSSAAMQAVLAAKGSKRHFVATTGGR